MRYTKEDIKSLIEHLKTYGESGLMYYPIYGVFEEHLENLTELSIPGDMISALIVSTLEVLFPDILFALKIPQEDLPLYLGSKTPLENIIATWRLKIGK